MRTIDYALDASTWELNPAPDLGSTPGNKHFSSEQRSPTCWRQLLQVIPPLWKSP